MDFERFEVKQIHKTTDIAIKADLVVENHQVETFWIPKSLCEMSPDNKVLQVQSWWAAKEIFQNE